MQPKLTVQKESGAWEWRFVVRGKQYAGLCRTKRDAQNDGAIMLSCTPWTHLFKVDCRTGFPVVEWIDYLNQTRHHTLYRRYGGQYYSERSIDPESRAEIVDALNNLEWEPGRDCLASAPWLQKQITP